LWHVTANEVSPAVRPYALARLLSVHPDRHARVWPRL